LNTSIWRGAAGNRTRKGEEMAENNATASAKFDEKTLKRAEFCMNKCTACKVGRDKGKGFFNWVVRLESKLKFCPWCRAYEKVYGVPAYQKPPEA
jgi:hypothetical protein